jgi:hypothetical protein
VLIRCSTCGTEFTSQAGVQEHIKTSLSNGPRCPDRRTASRCKGIRRYSFGKASKEGICPVGDAGLRFCHPFPDICWTRFSA